MEIEVLVTTMYCRNFEALYQQMNIKGKAVISNQGNENFTDTKIINHKTVKYISSNKRGVSLNRNTSMKASSGDILVVGDDDVVYCDNYEEIIINAYNQFPEADIILFHVPSTNPDRPTFELKKTKVLRFDELVRFAGFQITYKRKVIEKGIKFNECFGPGGRHFPDACGEDLLFLSDAFHKNHKIVYVKNIIGAVNHNESTWLSKSWSDKFFKGYGAIFYEINKLLYIPFAFTYAFMRYKNFKMKSTFIHALKMLLKGSHEYKEILKSIKRTGNESYIK